MRIEFTRDAERDLIDIYLHGLNRYGAAQAERYAEALQSRIGTASEVQQIGRSYDTLRPGLRRLECKAHAIYFRPIPGGIRVLRILHGKMDPGRHLL